MSTVPVDGEFGLAEFVAEMRRNAEVIRAHGTPSALAYADGVEQTVRGLERRIGLLRRIAAPDDRSVVPALRETSGRPA